MKISGTNELLEIDIQRTPSMTQGYTFGRGPLRSLFSCCLNFAYFCQRFLSLKLNVCKMKSTYKLIGPCDLQLLKIGIVSSCPICKVSE